MADVGAFVRAIELERELRDALAHHEVLPAEQAQFESDRLEGFDALQPMLEKQHISSLYTHQSRALQLIDELEPGHRGWYGGAVGYLGYDGGADFAICIRSAVARGDTMRVQAGGGIVYDSDPDAEDQECRNKASAVLRAIAMARKGRTPA